jgi:hypothetical protein
LALEGVDVTKQAMVLLHLCALKGGLGLADVEPLLLSIQTIYSTDSGMKDGVIVDCMWWNGSYRLWPL